MQNQKNTKADELLNFAFSQARKRAGKMPKIRNKFKRVRQEEILKIKAAADALAGKLDAEVLQFPNFSSLHPFYAELFEAIVQLAELKQGLARISSSAEIIKKIKREEIAKINRIYKKRETLQMQKIRNEFYGRAASIVKGLEKPFEFVEEARRKLQEKPEIKFDLPTVIIAGFPNVGKTTVLKRLTGSAPEIAAYPFTTKSIKIGYFRHKYSKIQVIDTPGLLDRPMEKRNPIERKAIAAIRHLANLIVFIVDPTTYSGYKLQEQIHLLAEVKALFQKIPFIVVINKADLASKEEIEDAEESACGTGIKKENVMLGGENLGNEKISAKITEHLKGFYS